MYAIRPKTISLHSGKTFTFNCTCGHKFTKALSKVTGKQKVWCQYCAQFAVCGNCDECDKRSLAGWFDKDKLACYIGEENPRNIALRTDKKIKFKCKSCLHVFEAKVYNVTKEHNPSWCLYCARRALCGNCDDCNSRSLFGWSNKEKLACYIGEEDPRQITLHSDKKVKFKCNVCTHVFESRVYKVTKESNPRWCFRCAGFTCGQDTCTICPPACSVCKAVDSIRKAFHTTPDGPMCRSCFRSSPHVSVSRRAKVSLEILMFAEIQRQAKKKPHFSLWAEPTAWDCAILPTLSYKPDNIWAFDHDGNVFSVSGACKINKSLISHVVIVEVLEIGIKQHSAARNVTDEQREKDIRQVFHPTKVDFLNVVVAAMNHQDAHDDDKFFEKQENHEYKVVRKKAWSLRIEQTLVKLQEIREARSGQTWFIGH